MEVPQERSTVPRHAWCSARRTLDVRVQPCRIPDSITREASHLSKDLGKRPVIWMLFLGRVNPRVFTRVVDRVCAGIQLDAHHFEVPPVLVGLLLHPVVEHKGLWQPLWRTVLVLSTLQTIH